MAQVVKLKRSSVEGKVPTTSNLELGELSINTHDGRIFFEKNDGSDSIEHIITTNSQTTGSIELIGNITASGNISGSLTGSFKHLKATTIEGNSPLNIIGVSKITFADAPREVDFGDSANLRGNPIFHGDVNVYSQSAFLDAVDNLFFSSNDGGQGPSAIITYGGIGGIGGSAHTRIYGHTITLGSGPGIGHNHIQHVTASGNISSSGNIIASTFYGDGSNLTGISSDPFPYTGSAEISGSLTVRDADTTLRGALNVKGEGTDTSILNTGGNVNSGGTINFDFKHHGAATNVGARIASSGTSYGRSTGLIFYIKNDTNSDTTQPSNDSKVMTVGQSGVTIHKNFEVLGGDLEFGHVGDNTSAEKRLGVRTDEPNQTQSSLHIEGGQATYSNRAGGHLRLKAGGGSGTGNSGEISFFTCTGSLSSGEENTVLERARFTPNGELGIGTTTPSEKLTVNGNISASGELIGTINGGSF